MTYGELTLCVINDRDGIAEKAMKLFKEELELRKVKVRIGGAPEHGLRIEFDAVPGKKDSFAIEAEEGRLRIAAPDLRGLVYGYSMFLRKTAYGRERPYAGVRLVRDISGSYAPAKPIRGHQLGYRPKNNTYDAWAPEDFYRYYRDMMMFGSNICELMPDGTDDGERNELMRLPANEMLVECSRLADELDMDVSVWYPNCEKSTPDEGARLRAEVLKNLKRLNVIFPPGGDPGDYPAGEFLERVILTKHAVAETHPEVRMWPSAQKPKRSKNWGNEFLAGLSRLPEEIEGVITGPNRAFALDELRKKLPMKYPIRLYPDLTHNVRCEYPVHFPLDDWHFAWASTMGRESINPRPMEYKRIHQMTSRYTCGSVSYSEGVNDDVNKMVWGWLEYAPDTPVTEILEDYARAFFPGADPRRAAEGILGLEWNWHGDPAENPNIENTLRVWRELLDENPELTDNWRFVSCLFRAEGDALVRARRVFELGLVGEAFRAMERGDYQSALRALRTPFDESYTKLRGDLDRLARILFERIGMQLNIADFHASGVERGAVLETIDNPITDRPYLLKKLEDMAELDGERRATEMAELYRHFKPESDELFYSVSVDGKDRFRGEGTSGYLDFAYLNFKGDNKKFNTGEIPVELLGVYDHYFFRASSGGFSPERDYVLRFVIPKRAAFPPDMSLYLTVNGRTLFTGGIDQVVRDEAYDAKWLSGNYFSIVFDLPREVFHNGCIDLEFGEKTYGVELSEMRIERIR